MEPVELFIFILFLHFVFDFYLQSHSNSMIKNKEWWKRHEGGRYNHIFGLLIHSFVWGYATCMIPIHIEHENHVSSLCYGVLIIHSIVHAITDHMKTNKKKISALEDQWLHILQCTTIWIMIISGKL